MEKRLSIKWTLAIMLAIILAMFLSMTADAQNWYKPKRTARVPGTFKQYTTQKVMCWIDKADSSLLTVVGSDTTFKVLVGTLPKKAAILSGFAYVQEAWNGGAQDSIEIGNSTDIDYYASDITVSSTGVQTVTLTSNRYNSGLDTVWAYYKRPSGESNPTAGNTLILLEYLAAPD